MAPTTVEEKIQQIQQKSGTTRKNAIRKLKASQRAGHKVQVSNEEERTARKNEVSGKTPRKGYTASTFGLNRNLTEQGWRNEKAENIKLGRSIRRGERAQHNARCFEGDQDVKSAAANDKTPVGGYAKGNRTRAANKLPATAAIAVLDTAVAEAVKELHTAPKAKKQKVALANPKNAPITVPAPKAAKTPAPPKERLTPEQVGAARKEGIRLFQLAGKPKPEDFLAVYGSKGPRMTWVDRAKQAGLASAEEAAATFQAMLAKVVKK